MSVEREGEFWPTRIGMLAAIAGADALAVVLRPQGEAFVTYAAHNIAPEAVSAGADRAALLAGALVQQGAAEGAVQAPLADGRTAVALRAVPVAWAAHRIGVLAAFRVAGPFADADCVTLDRVAALAALELVEENTFWRIQRAAAELDARRKASSALQEIVRAEKDPETLLAQATSGLARVFAADGVSIMLLEDGVLGVRSAIGLSDEARRDRKRVGEGISGFVAQTGQPLLLQGPLTDDPRFRGNDPAIGAALVAPLRNGDHITGVVSVKRRGAGTHFDTADLDALSAIGSDIAATLSFVTSVTRAEEDRKQAIALYELSRLGTLDDPQQELETAVAMLADVMHHDVVGLWTLDESGVAHRRAGRGYDAGALAIPPADQAGPLAEMLAGQQPIRTRAADPDRRPPWAAPGATEYVLAPVAGQGKVIGALILGRASGPYAEGEAAFAATAAEYLFELARIPDLGLMEEQAQADERRRIAQELHDGLAQELTGVVLSLEGAQRAFERNPQVLGQQLAKATRDARATLADVRQYMGALRQSGAGGLSLPSTVARLIDDLKRQTGLPVEMVETGTERDLPAETQRAVIRIVGEALRNVAQHAAAKHATVTIRYGEREVVVTIADDGAGFDPEGTVATAEAGGHFGLVGMRERATAAGGSLVVQSAPGTGTTICATLPYEGARPFVRAAAEADAPVAAAEKPGFLARLFGR